MHAWDQPAETLFRLAPERGAELVMPMMGQAAEPARADIVNPWWRSVAALDADGVRSLAPAPREEAPTLPPSADGSAVQWPLD